METGKYYSIRDLTNLSKKSNDSVTECMRFLSEYGFVRSFRQAELFTRMSKLSPAESAQLLSGMIQPYALANGAIGGVYRTE